MLKKHINRIITVVALLLLQCGCAENNKSFQLVKAGVSSSCIVTPGNYSSVELNAALELGNYLEKITGAGFQPKKQPETGKYPIYIGVVSNSAMKLPAKAARLAEGIKDDGFMLYSDQGGLYVVSKIPRGTLYGIYEVLKRFGNVRWIFPGEEGEYLDQRPDFCVPEIATVCNPSFQYRNFNLVTFWSSHLTHLWMIRNNMHVNPGKMAQANPYDIRQWGQPVVIGGEIFRQLLPDKLFAEHPEYFSLQKEGRIQQDNPETHRAQAQPCTTSPGGIQVMLANLETMLKKYPDAVRLGILNNDCGGWCLCDECRKLGSTAARYWYLCNRLLDKARQVNPQIDVEVHSYQDFQAPPEHVKPDSRASVNFCVHHRCYIHSMDDLTCEYNQRYRDILKAWHDLGMKGVGTYEYMNILPAWGYLPLEGIIARDLKYYHRIGNNAYMDEVLAYDGYSKDPVFNNTYFRGGIIAQYIKAYFMWDADADYGKVLEDVCSRFYGKTWPAMKKYRALLTECFERTNSYFCYGRGDSGKCLERPRAKERLLRYLDEAETLAAGNKFLENRVKFERERLTECFLKPYETYTHDDKKGRSGSILSGKLSGTITLDGNASEKAWDNSDFAHDFILADRKTPAINDTWIQTVYDNDCLYVYFEALGQPSPGEHLEFYLPGMSVKAFPNGEISGNNVKGKIIRETELWRGELRLPLDKKPQKGSSMMLGIVRNCKTETSSWNHGHTKMPQAGRRIVFGPRPYVANGDFYDAMKVEPGKTAWTNGFQPHDWMASNHVQLMTDNDSDKGQYVFTSDSGTIYQGLANFTGPYQTYDAARIYKGKIIITCDAKGRGNIDFSVRTSDSKNFNAPSIEVDSGEWKKYETIFDARETTTPFLYLFIGLSGKNLCIDNIDFEEMGGR